MRCEAKMKIGCMLKEALKSLFKKPVTVQYITKPGEVVPVSERYRGRIVYDREACIGCLLCIRTCPSGAISVTEDGKVAFSLDRCIFCGQCGETCPRKAIKYSKNFEISVYSRDELMTK